MSAPGLLFAAVSLIIPDLFEVRLWNVYRLLLSDFDRIGLLHQAWDLWSVHRRHAWQSTAERDGWIFAVGWRVGLCLWIAAVLVLDYLDAYGVISLAEPEEAMEQTGQLTRAALLRMTLLVSLVGASKHRVSVRAPGLRSRVIDFLGWSALLVLCFVICLDATILPMVIHVALRGMEASQQTWAFGVNRAPDAWVDLTDATNQFFVRATISAALTPVNLALTATLAWQWRRGVLRRLLIIAPLVVGLAIAADFVVWASRGGFAAISPCLAPFIAIEPVYRWFVLGALIGLAGATLGAQFCYQAGAWKPISDLPWCRRPWTYVHQRNAVLIAVITVCVAHMLSACADDVSGWWSRQAVTVGDVYYLVLDDPTVLLEFAIVLVASRALRSNRLRAVNDYSTGPFFLSLPAWATVSFAMIATMAFGLPTLYWFTFAMWLRS